MGKASRAKREQRDLTGEEIDALVKKRETDRQERVKRAQERLQAIEDEEQVTLILQPEALPPQRGQVGVLVVTARRAFVPKELLQTVRVPADADLPRAE